MGDIILGKTRYYAGDGNALEEILRAQKIKTVVISGVRTSGVVLSTVYRLFDLDYTAAIVECRGTGKGACVMMIPLLTPQPKLEVV